MTVMNKYTISLFLLMMLMVRSVAAETRIFDLRHRSALDVASTLQDALGSEARVVPVRHSLMISASAADLALAADLIARLDRPAQMLRIYVAQEQQTRDEGSVLGGSVVGRSGDATIAAGHSVPPFRGGATVVVGGEHGVIAGSGSATTRSESRRSEQFVVTLEGAPARISVGENLPFTERWLILARRHVRVEESTRYVSVDTGFEVIPELLGANQVELTIHPFMTFVDGTRHSRQIRFSELSTRVRAPIDTWVDLGGTISRGDEVSREILSVARREGEGRGNVSVRVELQPN